MIVEKPTSIRDLFLFKPKKEGGNYLPIVYSDNYNIRFWNLENLHPFNTQKWGEIHNRLQIYFQVLIFNNFI